MLATEIPLPVPGLLIRCCPDIVLLGHDFGLNYHRETHTKVSVRTIGSAGLAVGDVGTHLPVLGYCIVSLAAISVPFVSTRPGPHHGTRRETRRFGIEMRL
jgi:hypothetical protein